MNNKNCSCLTHLQHNFLLGFFFFIFFYFLFYRLLLIISLENKYSFYEIENFQQNCYFFQHNKCFPIFQQQQLKILSESKDIPIFLPLFMRTIPYLTMNCHHSIYTHFFFFDIFLLRFQFFSFRFFLIFDSFFVVLLLFWFRFWQVGVQVEVCADLVPVGEAAVFHSVDQTHKIGARLGHVVSELISHLFVHKVNLSQVGEHHNVQLKNSKEFVVYQRLHFSNMDKILLNNSK